MCMYGTQIFHQNFFKIFKCRHVKVISAHVVFNACDFSDFLMGKFRKFDKFHIFSPQTSTTSPANYGTVISKSANLPYNTYIPQTGNYEFAAFLEVKSRICKKFAVIEKKICGICRTLRKILHQFLEFYGGTGDPSTAEKYDFLSVFSGSVLVRLNPYRWGRPMLSST